MGLTHRDIWQRRNATAPLWLYRLTDAHGRLLYVGVTRDLRARLSAHRREKPWWPEVARHESRWYADRAEALAAELDAIDAESPTFNIVARGRLRKVKA